MPRHKPRTIGISLGLIGSLSDGLGEFSTQLGERIAAAAPAWQDEGIRFVFHMPTRWHGRFGEDVSYITARKSDRIWNWRPGHRFAIWHALNQLGSIAPPSRTRSALLTIHDLNPLYYEPELVANKALSKLRSRLERFNGVTTLTRHVESDIRSHLGWQGEVTVIPNGARNLVDHPRTPVPGLTEGGFMLHLSRMAASKNPQSIIDLAAHWPEKMFVLAGPTSKESTALAEQSAQRGLSNVRMHLDVTDAQKAWLYANCECFLFPSITEGFGLPPLEAMHFGKPVYLSRLTSLPEIGGAQAAYFDDGFSPAAMKSVILRERDGLRARADSIRRHAAGFTWDRAAASYLQLYRRHLAG